MKLFSKVFNEVDMKTRPEVSAGLSTTPLLQVRSRFPAGDCGTELRGTGQSGSDKGMSNKQDIVSHIRQQVEFNKRRKGIYEISCFSLYLQNYEEIMS